MPKAIALHRELKGQGLVLLGIHTTNGGAKMAGYAKEAGIDFPIAIDVDKTTTTAFRVDSYPDYYLIDRAGRLRVADIQNGDFERAVKALLAEPAPAAAKAAVHHVDAAGAAKLIAKQKALTVLDVRTPREYGRGHIANSKHIDFMKDDFKAKVGELNRSVPVLVYCASGGRSTKSLETLQALGFATVYHLDGGIRAWTSAGQKVEK